METNGITLNRNREQERKDKSLRSLIVGALSGVGLAAALGAAFTLGGCNGSETAATQPASSAFHTIGVPNLALTGTASGNAASSNSDEPKNRGASDGGGVDAPTVAPEQPEEDEPTPTPTNTPEPGPCQFCPDDVDDLQIEPTPDYECAFCFEGGFTAELATLAFEFVEVDYCAMGAVVTDAANRDANIWVTYSLDGDEQASYRWWNGDRYYTRVALTDC